MHKPARRVPFGLPPDLAVLAASIFLWGLGEGLFNYFYPLSLQYWKLDPVQIGLVLGLLGGIMAVVQLPAGWLSDRFGPRPLIRAACILGVLCALVMGFARSMPVFLAGLMAYSLTSFIQAPLSSYISSMRGSWSVQRALTFITASMMVGGIAGPTLGGWIAGTAGLPTLFRCSAGLFLVSTVVIFFAKAPVRQGQPEPSAHGRLSPLANPRFIALLGVVFFTIFALNLPTQLASLYLQNVHHLTFQQIGLTGTIGGLGTAVVMFALGGLGTSTGMLVGQLLIGAFSLLLWRGQNAAVFFAGYLFVGGTRLYRSMTLAFARPLVKASEIGFAYGLVETVNALAIILAPLAAGFLYNYRPEAGFIAGLGALALTIGLNLLLSLKKGSTSIN